MRGTTDADRGLAARVKVKTVKGGTIEVSRKELDAAPKYRKEGLRQVVGRIWDKITYGEPDADDKDSDPRRSAGSAQGGRG
jgi:hypothetical protein